MTNLHESYSYTSMRDRCSIFCKYWQNHIWRRVSFQSRKQVWIHIFNCFSINQIATRYAIFFSPRLWNSSIISLGLVFRNHTTKYKANFSRGTRLVVTLISDINPSRSQAVGLIPGLIFSRCGSQGLWDEKVKGDRCPPPPSLSPVPFTERTILLDSD